jgi:hypothetical protein
VWNAIQNFLKPKQTPTKQVKIATPTPMPNEFTQLKSQIDKGFQKYATTYHVPVPAIATKSAELAQAGLDIKHAGGEALLPAIQSIKETGGLKDAPGVYQDFRVKNAPFGVLNEGKIIAYPDLKTSIVGGNGRQGFRGVTLGYKDYLKSHDLRDFYKKYTPYDISGQIKRHDEIKSSFE